MSITWQSPRLVPYPIALAISSAMQKLNIPKLAPYNHKEIFEEMCQQNFLTIGGINLNNLSDEEKEFQRLIVLSLQGFSIS